MRAYKAIGLFLLATSVSACSYVGDKSMSGSSTQEFVKEAASGDQFEIASGKLAMSKSRDNNVRQVAQRLISDHTKSSSQLKMVLANEGMQAPPPRLTEDQQENLNKMKKARHFDKVFLDTEKDDHEEDIQKFQDYMNNGDNDALRNFASQTLPTLRQHLEMVEQAQQAHQNRRHNSDSL